MRAPPLLALPWALAALAPWLPPSVAGPPPSVAGSPPQIGTGRAPRRASARAFAAGAPAVPGYTLPPHGLRARPGLSVPPASASAWRSRPAPSTSAAKRPAAPPGLAFFLHAAAPPGPERLMPSAQRISCSVATHGRGAASVLQAPVVTPVLTMLRQSGFANEELAIGAYETPGAGRGVPHASRASRTAHRRGRDGEGVAMAG